MQIIDTQYLQKHNNANIIVSMHDEMLKKKKGG